MKKLLLLISLFFLATTFQSIPPGWFQQVRPVNKFITDVFFIDSLKGWAVTNWDPSFDTAYIFNTTNGGDNWSIQFKDKISFSAIQFLDSNLGYALGGASLNGSIKKTTNGGVNWFTIAQIPPNNVDDMYFVNSDTGWVCGDDLFDGGVYKTTNGGMNWQLQLNSSYEPSRLFFLNNDTGWAIVQNRNLFKTTNSGINWVLQASFATNNPIKSVFFINKNTGWLVNTSSSSLNGIYKTTNSGQNWISQVDPTPTGSGVNDVFFIDSLKGWIACGFAKILATTNGGQNWYIQTTPVINYTKIQFIDSNKGWASGSGIVHTTDGGGLSDIEQIGNEMPSEYELFQNYPNPFNPVTNIGFQISDFGFVKLDVYNITGKLIQTLIAKNMSAGKYRIDFDARNLPSGVYFYILNFNEKFIETKKMILLK